MCQKTTQRTIFMFKARTYKNHSYEVPLLTLNACCGREWSTSFVFINFEYESNGFCKYGKGEICWHGVGENYHDLKKIKIHGVECTFI